MAQAAHNIAQDLTDVVADIVAKSIDMDGASEDEHTNISNMIERIVDSSIATFNAEVKRLKKNAAHKTLSTSSTSSKKTRKVTLDEDGNVVKRVNPYSKLVAVCGKLKPATRDSLPQVRDFQVKVLAPTFSAPKPGEEHSATERNWIGVKDTIVGSKSIEGLIGDTLSLADLYDALHAGFIALDGKVNIMKLGGLMNALIGTDARDRAVNLSTIIP